MKNDLVYILITEDWISVLQTVNICCYCLWIRLRFPTKTHAILKMIFGFTKYSKNYTKPFFLINRSYELNLIFIDVQESENCENEFEQYIHNFL